MPYEQIAYMHRDPITLNGQLEDFLEFFRGVAAAEGIEIEQSGDKDTKDSGDASKDDASKDGASKDGASKDDASKDDAKKDEAKQ